MKDNILIKDHELIGDYSWDLRRAFFRGYVIAKWQDKLIPFLEQNLQVECDINSNKIEICKCNRQQLMDLLKIFGGKWEKEVEVWAPDQMSYFQEIEDAILGSYRVTLRGEPPPSCQVVEEEVEVPARKEIRRRIVCPTPTPDEAAEVVEPTTTA